MTALIKMSYVNTFKFKCALLIEGKKVGNYRLVKWSYFSNTGSAIYGNGSFMPAIERAFPEIRQKPFEVVLSGQLF